MPTAGEVVNAMLSTPSFTAWKENKYARRTSFHCADNAVGFILSYELAKDYTVQVEPCQNERIGGWIVLVQKP